MKKCKSIGTIWLFSIVMTFCILTFSIEWAVFDHSFFMKQVEENHVQSATGMTTDTLSTVTLEILSYLDGVRPDFDIHAQRYGHTEALFSLDEQRHMEDVLALMTRCKQMFAVTIGVGGVLSFVLLKQEKSQLGRAFCCTAFLGLLLLLLAICLSTTDFTAVFEAGHRLIFSNNLWLLDPSTDILINIVPEPYFIALASYIGRVAAIGFISFGILGCILIKKK